ncbi:acireductone dioxygenase [Pseudomonas gingeri]|uniref:1,2-dihydroxy-3-keto-5-methylthiopentene dioxygenase n=1 Tax=Pseudomonas TaxID=286 RepID=UPI0015A4D561|nr:MULTISPECIES: acireductone dioxygenase [Pseudomonas]NVZ28096.1 acireductone dioxygenase [Pseudomonas gingeri]BBP78470.1 acireductone dioxygenase [Pseudomonas sp. Ost2]
MSSLSVYPVATPDLPNKVLTHVDDIASTLAEHGVRFERLPATTPVRAGAGHEEVLAAYRGQIDQLMSERGSVSVEVISLDGDHPQSAELCAAGFAEQQHAASEVRFFVAGRGLLSLHIGDYVYAVLCERNDLVSLPAGTRHWFDMGDNPRCVVIRLFDKSEGRVVSFTGEDIASHFPRLDD